MSTFMAVIFTAFAPLALLFFLVVTASGVVGLTLVGLTRSKNRRVLSGNILKYQQFGSNRRKGIDRRESSDRRLSENNGTSVIQPMEYGVSHKQLMVINHQLIARPIQEVARYAAHPDSAPHWYAKFKDVTWHPRGDFAVGSVLVFRSQFLGKSSSYTYVVKEFIPGHRLVMTTDQGLFPLTTEYVWVSTKQDHTKMTIKNSGHPTGFSRYVKPVLRWSMNRANQRDLRLLKSILEKQ